MHYPDILDADAKKYYSLVGESSMRAEAVIAVSEATRQDIAQFLDIPIDEIDVVYEAAAPLFRPIELREGEARVLNGVPVAADSFLLFVSTLEPRKNLPTLFQALRICLDRRPDRNYKLVVVGGRGWHDEPIFASARDLNLGNNVLFAGNVGQYDLRWLYNACRMYVNPSLYEGFGIPLLEAMACGAASLVSATSSLPEVGGDAAMYVPPLDPGLWADAIESLWNDQERREELGRLGRARAQRFSWLRAARETMKIYERVVSGAPRKAFSPVDDERLPPEIVYDFSPRGTTSVLGHQRGCLRCGTLLTAGALQTDLFTVPSEQGTSQQSVVSRAWVCSNCGYVELVRESVGEAEALASHTDGAGQFGEAIGQTETPQTLASDGEAGTNAAFPAAASVQLDDVQVGIGNGTDGHYALEPGVQDGVEDQPKQHTALVDYSNQYPSRADDVELGDGEAEVDEVVETSAEVGAPSHRRRDNRSRRKR
jgi:hypothetical protein